MTLVQLFLMHRYRADSVHYLTPTADNVAQTSRMHELGMFRSVTSEIGDVIVAEVDGQRLAELVQPDGAAMDALIAGSGAATTA
jgi:isocitrate lyase